MVSVDTSEHPVVLFDGVCNLCNGFVQFLIERDPEKVFRFAPLQSDVAEDLLGPTSVDPDLDSVLLVEDGRVYAKSAAALRILRRLDPPYNLLYPSIVVPRPIRDAVYDFVADHRYGWFGKREQCMLPTPDVKERFLVESALEAQ